MEIEVLNKLKVIKLKDIPANSVFRGITNSCYYLKSSFTGFDGGAKVIYCLDLSNGNLERIHESVPIHGPLKAKLTIDWE